MALSLITALFVVLSSVTFVMPIVASASESVSSDDVVLTDTSSSNGEIVSAERDYPTSQKAYCYLLQVSTGTSAGDNVIGFKITYKNSRNKNCYSEIIFPNLAKKQAYQTAADVGYNFMSAKQQYSEVELYDESSLSGDGEALQSGQFDQLLVDLPYSLSELVSITVFCDYNQGGNNTWSCQSMAFYYVDTIYGLDAAGYIGQDYYMVFDGRLIAKTSEGMNLTTSGKPQAFTFSFDASDKYKLDKTFDDGTIDYSADDSYAIFEMDISDVYGAGLEYLETFSYTGCTVEDIIHSEALNLTLTYTDICGAELKVKVPLVTSYYLSLRIAYGTNDSAIEKSKTIGIFQQGDTIALRLFLPGYVAAKKCSIAFTDNSSEFSYAFPGTVDIYGDFPFFYTNDTKFSVSAIRIYDQNTSDLSYTCNGTCFTPVHTGTPSYYVVTKSYSGTDITLNSSAGQFTLNTYRSGVTTSAKFTTSYFLFAITTDGNVNSAGSVNDAYIKINYTKNNGTSVESSEFNIREMARNFYGNWMSNLTSTQCFCSKIAFATKKAYGRAEDMGYYVNMQSGKTLYFAVPLSDVSSFTGVKLRLNGTDEWQISNISIYRLSSYQHRTAKWEDLSLTAKCAPVQFGMSYLDYTLFQQSFQYNVTCDGYSNSEYQTVTTNRNITRDYEGVECARYDASVLLQANDEKSISFENGSVYTEDVNWEEYTYYMSYEATKQNLGFTKARISYRVDVQVGDDVTGDNDCGSKNQFYFQLVFASGKSGYVLANQQLSADGFRTGMLESFNISVNRDYGNLEAIHIIPENPNDSEEAYDKLKIDYINVTRVETSGFSMTWTVSIGDWISIDYQDTAAQDSVGGQAGRSEADLARTFVVTGTGYVANILVAFTTAAYTNGTQFAGHISAEIKYRDSNDQDQIMTVDVTQAMYEYANRSKVGSIYLNGGEYARNDKSFMMREYHTDRFTVSISGLKQVQSITFSMFDDNEGDWTVSNVSMYLVQSSGQRTINANQEYEIAGSKSLLATSVDTDGFTTRYYNNINNSPEIQMSDNLVTVEDNGTSLSASVDYVPQNKDDTMNIYVHMSKLGSSLSSYDMDCAIAYGINLSTDTGSEITDKIYQKSVKLRTDASNYLYYATGISASGLVNVCSLTLKADTYSTSTRALVDYVVVEHVRSGVAIESYYIPFGNVNAAISSVTAKPTGSGQTSANYSQKVYFMLSASSEQNVLVNKTADIAISITYTSMDGVTSHTLTSPNLFLSENNASILYPGRVYCVTFDQQNVTAITGISFIATGNIANSVGISNACAGNYLVDASGEETCLGWYSFAGGLDSIGTSIRTMILTGSNTDSDSTNSTTVSPVTVTIKTAEAGTDTESGTSCPVRMTLSYYDSYGDLHNSVFSNIASHATSGSTSTGDTIVVPVLLNNMASLRSITLEPYASGYTDNPSWTISSISASSVVDGVSTELSRAVNSTATEGSAVTVNLGAVLMSVNVFSYDSSTRKSYNKVFTSSASSSDAILIGTDGEITFTPTISGSSQGIGFTCYKVVNGTTVECDDVCEITGTSTNVRKVVFAGDNAVSAGQYKLVFTSAEFPSVTTEIFVNVEGEETTTEAPTTEYVTEAPTTEYVTEAPTSSFQNVTEPTSRYNIVG